MKRFLFGCCFSLAYLYTISQKTIDVEKENIRVSGGLNYLDNVAGVPFVNAKFVRLISGSPFFKDEMMKGILISHDSTEYKNVIIRLNLLESQVNYLDKKKNEMIVGTPLREVILWDTVNNKQYQFVFFDYIKTTNKPEKDFYELLQKGKAELFKQHKKVMKEERPYNSATYEQFIQTNIRYFVLLDGQWKKVVKVKDLVNVLADKKAEVQQFINSKGLSGDNGEDLEAVISYYNGLFVNK
jgi:hypothetical protein